MFEIHGELTSFHLLLCLRFRLKLAIAVCDSVNTDSSLVFHVSDLAVLSFRYQLKSNHPCSVVAPSVVCDKTFCKYCSCLCAPLCRLQNTILGSRCPRPVGLLRREVEAGAFSAVSVMNIRWGGLPESARLVMPSRVFRFPALPNNAG